MFRDSVDLTYIECSCDFLGCFGHVLTVQVCVFSITRMVMFIFSIYNLPRIKHFFFAQRLPPDTIVCQLNKGTLECYLIDGCVRGVHHSSKSYSPVLDKPKIRFKSRCTQDYLNATYLLPCRVWACFPRYVNRLHNFLRMLRTAPKILLPLLIPVISMKMLN